VSNIVKHKSLLGIYRGFEIEEVRLFDIILSREYRREGFKEGQVYNLDARYYAEFCGIETKEAYRQLKDITLRFYDAKIQKDVENWVTLKKFLFSIFYNEESYCIEFMWNPDIIKYISGEFHKGTFNSIPSTFCLTSSTKRYLFLEYLQSEEYKIQKFGSLKIEVEALKSLLGKENEYKLFGDFKKRVIEPGIQEFNKFTGNNLTVCYKKTGKKITSLEFYYERTNDN
jgi:plasmid replication initiation protein